MFGDGPWHISFFFLFQGEPVYDSSMYYVSILTCVHKASVLECDINVWIWYAIQGWRIAKYVGRGAEPWTLLGAATKFERSLPGGGEDQQYKRCWPGGGGGKAELWLNLSPRIHQVQAYEIRRRYLYSGWTFRNHIHSVYVPALFKCKVMPLKRYMYVLVILKGNCSPSQYVILSEIAVL